MKKIKKKIAKRKITGIPQIGLFLHVELRHSLARFTLRWLQELKSQLTDEIDLQLWVSGEADSELDTLLETLKLEGVIFERITVSRGQSRGKKLNEGLKTLRAQETLDAVIPIAPGDLLTADLLRAYGEHLKSGGLFSGLLDQYLYDPSSMRCMHWARAEFYQGSKRACELGMMMARPLLDTLKWQLWPSSSDKGLDALHTGVMERMADAFSLAPPKTCLLQSMKAYGAPVASIKSELGRVLFDEGNWQKLPGLSFADFELVFEEHLGETWLERIEDFDERIHLEVLVERPPPRAEHEVFWREFHQFLPLKFDPYARVRINVICSADEVDEIEAWGPEWRAIVTQSTSEDQEVARWNEAINQLREEEAEVVLLGGRGSVVDLKTIEHYLIYLFKNGARLMSASNFFVALTDERQGNFWPGTSNATFADIFGFGTCVHHTYLDRLGASPLAESGGLTTAARESLRTLQEDKENKHQRVMFQCVAHKLGLIAFDPEGAIGFTPQIRLTDLKEVKLSNHIPGPAFTQKLHRYLSDWFAGQALVMSSAPQSDAPYSLSTSTTSPTAAGESHMSQDQSLSPLERAKALLQQSKVGASAPATPAAPADPATSEMSPLERAKALLKQSQAPAEPAVAAPTSAPAATSEMSPLERAKALLQQSKGDAPAPTPATTTSATPELSPLERAKALLKQSQAPSEPTVAEVDVTQVAINEAVKGAEAMVEQLQAQLNAARAQEEQAQQSQAPSPADVICEQGEAIYASGDESRAASLFESALLVDPSCARALNNLGVIALSGSEPWRALSYLLMGLMQDPANEDITLNLQGIFDLHPEMSATRAVIFDS